VQKFIEKAEVLVAALPYIKGFYGKTVVVKYGGSAMIDNKLKDEFARDIVLMKYIGMNPVIVHGGGNAINNVLDKLGKIPEFVDGLRVTDEETMEIVEMVLVGKVNKEIVGSINRHGGKAVGLSGKDGMLIRANKVGKEASSIIGLQNNVDYGRVGEVDVIDPSIIELLDKDRFIPVIAPTGVCGEGKSFNINADIVAGEIAAALKAEKLLMLTDVDGILNEEGEKITSINEDEVRSMISTGVLKGGMLPKIHSCLLALQAGVKKAHIINGKIKHSLILELFTEEGIGTEIVK